MSLKLTFCSGRDNSWWISNMTLRAFGVRMFPFGSVALNINVCARLSSSKRFEIQSLFTTAWDPSLLLEGFVSHTANISEFSLKLRKPIAQSPVKSMQQKMTRKGFLAMNRPSLSKPFSNSLITRICIIDFYSCFNFMKLNQAQG